MGLSTIVQCFSFYFYWCQKNIDKLVLNMGCLIKLLKLNGKLLEKQTRLQKIKIKQKGQYFHLRVSRHNQRSIFLLKTTGLKLIPRKDKMIFTTWCFNDTFLVNTTPMELYFMFPLGVPKKLIRLISTLMPLQ